MLDIYILQGRQNGLLVTTDDSSSLGVVASDNSRIRSRGRLVQEDGSNMHGFLTRRKVLGDTTRKAVEQETTSVTLFGMRIDTTTLTLEKVAHGAFARASGMDCDRFRSIRAMPCPVKPAQVSPEQSLDFDCQSRERSLLCFRGRFCSNRYPNYLRCRINIQHPLVWSCGRREDDDDGNEWMLSFGGCVGRVA
jgi:hypothetical protein